METVFDKSQRSGYKILVIDDEPAVRNILAQALADPYYLIYLADGTNVADFLNARQYDVIITDLRMPGMDGLQVLALAKEKSPKSGLIVVTGYPSEQSLQLCREFNVARYMVKPFGIDEIRLVVQNVIRAKRYNQIGLLGNHKTDGQTCKLSAKSGQK